MKLPNLLFRSKLLNTGFSLCKIHSSTKTCAKVNVCVVGSGPAGFYTAKQLLQDENKDIHVDIYEKLPVPFGLIRYGVAPDHPRIKNVTVKFTEIVTAGRCSFYGNVNVGKDISVLELLKMYNAVVLSYGASEHNDLGIPGEDTSNVLSARSFVGWFNGVPENAEEKINLDVEVAAVIGQGNVALDVARILLRSTGELKSTDIAEHAFETLKNSRIKKVLLIGRRGPLSAAFAIKEFREMTKLSECHAIMHPEDFSGVADLVPSMERSKKRMVELMLETVEASAKPHSNSKEFELKFFRSPKLLLSNSNNKVEKLVLGINKLEGPPDSGKVIRTANEEVIDCGLILKSIGYRSTPIDSYVPFDSVKCIIPNKFGKALGENCRGLYCSGWLKTGPKGVIPTTMSSSYETAETILIDLGKGAIPTELRPGSSESLNLLKSRGIQVVNFDQWQKIDEAELERGKAVGKPREKIVNVSEMLQIAKL